MLKYASKYSFKKSKIIKSVYFLCYSKYKHTPFFIQIYKSINNFTQCKYFRRIFNHSYFLTAFEKDNIFITAIINRNCPEPSNAQSTGKHVIKFYVSPQFSMRF